METILFLVMIQFFKLEFYLKFSSVMCYSNPKTTRKAYVYERIKFVVIHTEHTIIQRNPCLYA